MECLKELLEYGANINAINDKGDNPAVEALRNTTTECLKLFIKHGVDVRALTVEGKAALHYLSSQGKTEFVRLLLQEVPGYVPTHEDFENALHICAKNGSDPDLECLKFLLSEFIKRDIPKKYLTRASCAASSRNTAVYLDQLVLAGAPYDAPDTDGTTPPFLASKNSTSNCLKKLLRLGVSANSRHQGLPILYIVALNGNIDSVKALLENGADVNIKASDGRTPLHAAAAKGNTECLKLLLEKKANVTIQSKNGETALHLAAQKGNVECAKLLIDSGIDLSSDKKDQLLSLAKKNVKKDVGFESE